MTKQYAARGTDDTVTTCELCGRVELKSTVKMEILDSDGNGTGEIVNMGSDCAARAAGWTQREVREATKAADRAAREAQTSKVTAAADDYLSWLESKTGKTGPEAMAELGGFSAARELYKTERGA